MMLEEAKNEKFGIMLRRFRELAGLSMRNFAAYLDCRYTTISRLEAGKFNPSKKVSLSISRFVSSATECLEKRHIVLNDIVKIAGSTPEKRDLERISACLKTAISYGEFKEEAGLRIERFIVYTDFLWNLGVKVKFQKPQRRKKAKISQVSCEDAGRLRRENPTAAEQANSEEISILDTFDMGTVTQKRNEALYKLGLIKELEKARKDAKVNKRNLLESMRAFCLSKDVPLRTIQRWMDKYKEWGIIGLIDKR